MDVKSASWLSLTLIGSLTLTSILYKTHLFLTFHFLPFGNSLKKYQRQPRAWAIVTGASAGIGFGHIQELARRGFGVIILAHKVDEVNEAVAQVKAEFPGVAVEKVILDAAKARYSDIDSALAPIIHLPITVLVNNVSVQQSKSIFTHFESYTPADIDSSIAANNRFTCDITRILYPVLKRNGPSLIINISSAGHSIGLPWMTVYCGTKGFTEAWSRAMMREAKVMGDPIDIIAILPGDVRTQGNVYGVSAGSPNGREFAKMTLDRIARAVDRDRKVFIPYWKHDVTIGLTKILPDGMVAEGAIADMSNRKSLEEKAQQQRIKGDRIATSHD